MNRLFVGLYLILYVQHRHRTIDPRLKPIRHESQQEISTKARYDYLFKLNENEASICGGSGNRGDDENVPNTM
jgi:hypothetical protein